MIAVGQLNEACRRVCNSCGASMEEGSAECSGCGKWYGSNDVRTEPTTREDFRTIYPVDWWRFSWIFLACGVIAAKALWFILGHGPNSLGDLLFGAFVVLVVLEGTGLLIHVARKTYLVLTRQGVEYHGAWCSLYTPWDNVVCGSAYGLLLRCEPAFRGREWCRPVAAQQPSGTGYATASGFGASGSRVVVASQLGMVFARTCVPLNEFASKWRQSALGRDIAYYAPQVFGQVPASLLEPADPDQIVAPPPWWPTATRLISMRTYLWGYAAIHAALLLVLVLIWHVATA